MPWPIRPYPVSRPDDPELGEMRACPYCPSVDYGGPKVANVTLGIPGVARWLPGLQLCLRQIGFVSADDVDGVRWLFSKVCVFQECPRSDQERENDLLG